MYSCFLRTVGTLTFAAPLACSSSSNDSSSSTLEHARALGQALAKACPEADPASEAARESCASALAGLDLLRAPADSRLSWGGQKTPGDYDLSHSQTTLFNPYVFRRLYLSTYMFTGDTEVEEVASRTILRASVVFRGNLDPGDYPYPFWHSANKWVSYERTRELAFIYEDEELRGVLRTADTDPERPHLEREFDGKFVWASERGEEPQVTLYRWLFSADNPHVEDLDRTYRAFEEAQREVNCFQCHLPANPQAINPLELFSFPNQALSSRHAIVKTLEQDQMPPADATNGNVRGIPSADYRNRLIELAQEFAATGDRALTFEGEP